MSLIRNSTYVTFYSRIPINRIKLIFQLEYRVKAMLGYFLQEKVDNCNIYLRNAVRLKIGHHIPNYLFPMIEKVTYITT